jgi:hypothetical protein
VGLIEGGPHAVVEDPAARHADGARRILFGDLHVHTTYSIDAFIYSLPLVGGEGTAGLGAAGPGGRARSCARCGDLPATECEARVREARRLALEADVSPHRVFPDTWPEDWLHCDQCRDCFKTAYNLRPMESARYGLAVANSDDAEGRPLRFRFEFLASSDDHKAQAATGYKQQGWSKNTDAGGIASPLTDRIARPFVLGRQRDPQRPQRMPREPLGFRELFDIEWVASFFYPGSLVAVHATGRDRDRGPAA